MRDREELKRMADQIHRENDAFKWAIVWIIAGFFLVSGTALMILRI